MTTIGVVRHQRVKTNGLDRSQHVQGDSVKIVVLERELYILFSAFTEIRSA